jgi:peptidoglycan hydrolase CwlO-like protein
MLALIRKIPWWAWAVLLIVIVLIWQNLTGWAAARQVYTQALDNLRTDQSRVVEALQENQKMYEAEIAKLQTELEKVQKQKQEIVVQRNRLLSENEVYKGRIRELQAQRDSIVVPSDLAGIIDGFHKLGFGSVK